MFRDLLNSPLLSWPIVTAVLLLAGVFFIAISGMVRYIPNSRIGVVEKLWSSSGSVKADCSRCDGEAGFQPEVLRGGFHFFAPFQYRVHIRPMVSVTQGKIGYVFARDGSDLSSGQTLADNAKTGDFRDARALPRAAAARRVRSARCCAKAHTSSTRRCSSS